MLLNIDKPRRTCTLHEPNCSKVPSPYGTHHKPVGQLGRDGGWFVVGSIAEAQTLAALNCPDNDFISCAYCQET